MAGVAVAQAARYGIARGLFSNEAGMGSTPHAHAVAQVAHPVEQGVLGIIAVCLLFFAFSTVIGWYYFGKTNIRYLFGHKALLPYQILVMLFIFTGSVLKIDLVWELSDFFNGIMVIPNLIAILLLSGKVARLLNEYNQGIAYDRDRILNSK